MTDVITRTDRTRALSSRPPLLRAVITFATLAVVVVLLTVLGSLGGPALGRVFIAAIINLILVLGLYAFSGTSGVMSFGQAAFALIGAYVSGILAMPPAQRELLLPNLPGWVAGITLPELLLPLVAAGVAAVVALPLGLVISRLNGVVGSIGTFAVLVIANEVASNTQATNGAAGISGVPVSTTIQSALFWGLLVLLATVFFRFSKPGLLLRASKSDPFAAQASGVNIRAGRHLAYVISAALSAIGGSLYAQFVGSFTPDSFFLSMTTLTIAMLVVGGTGSVTGALVGCAAVTVVYQLLQRAEAATGSTPVGHVTGLAEMGLAVALLLTLILRPVGLTRGQELELNLFKRRGAGSR